MSGKKIVVTVSIIVAVILVGVLVYSVIAKNYTPVGVVEPASVVNVEPEQEIANGELISEPIPSHKEITQTPTKEPIAEQQLETAKEIIIEG